MLFYFDVARLVGELGEVNKLVWGEHKLVVRNDFALLEKLVIGIQHIFDVANQFLACILLVLESCGDFLDGHMLASLWSNLQLLHIDCSACHLVAFCLDGVAKGDSLNWHEEVFVVDFHDTRFSIGEGGPNVLIVVLDFPCMCVRLTVWVDDTITVEVVVAGRETTIVATIGPNLLACHLALATKTLVDVVPNISSLVLRELTNEVPIFLETADGITHSMGIFALDEWTRIVALGITLATTIVVVHRAENIGLAVLSCLFVLHWTRLVVTLNPIVGIFEVLAVACFVTQTPNDDGRMVLQHQHIVLIALDVSIVVVGTLGKCLVAITHSVALDIGFSSDVNAIDVAELIPTWVVRIVAGAHGIHIELLHHLDVLNHAVNTHDIATIGVEFMTVNTLDKHGLSVHEQLGILDFHLAETYMLRDALQELVAIVERSIEGVEIWSFCRPLQRIRERSFHFCPTVVVNHG